MAVKIFFCYAHEDENLLNKLKAHLKPLQRLGLIDIWYDRDLSAGTEWEQEINKHLNEANLILLLVSPDFMDSDYCYGIEMKRAIERHESEKACVIPIILRPVIWQGAPFGKLQALPMDAKPVVDNSWQSIDEAFFKVAVDIKRIVDKFFIPHEVIVEADIFPQTSVEHQQLTVTLLDAATNTDVGKQREQNEDSTFIQISEDGSRGLFIVADGMGGYGAGEVASKLAVQKISYALKSFLMPEPEQPTMRLIHYLPTYSLHSTEMTKQTVKQRKTRKLPETSATNTVLEQLKAAIRYANKAILDYGEEQSSARGLGCTVTTALIQSDLAFIANIGDSRTYLYREGTLKPLTKDHSLVYRLVEAKKIEPDDIYSHPQRNLIYRSLGAGHKHVDPDVFHTSLRSGDKLLLCSDGLWEMVRDQYLANILMIGTSPQEICDMLIDNANDNGGEDNISAIVVCVY